MTLILLFAILLTILAVIAVIYLLQDPPLPENTREIIKTIQSGGLPELLNGTTGYTHSEGIKIWYETIGKAEAEKGTILLINGFTAPATLWHPELIRSLVQEGYRVIRFDNRSVGLSDWMKGWTRENAYTIEDMMSDAQKVLEINKVDKVHLMGYSLGGYLAMRLAIEDPQRVLSLTLLSSSADLLGREHPRFNWTAKHIVRLAIRSRLFPSDSNFLKFFLSFMEHLEGQPLAVEELQVIGEMGLYEVKRRNGFNKMAARQQLGAIRSSKPIYDEIEKLDIPALVVHGERDAVLSFDKAKRYAGKLKNARSIWIPDAGHVITKHYLEQFMPEFLNRSV